MKICIHSLDKDALKWLKTQDYHLSLKEDKSFGCEDELPFVVFWQLVSDCFDAGFAVMIYQLDCGLTMLRLDSTKWRFKTH